MIEASLCLTPDSRLQLNIFRAPSPGRTPPLSIRPNSKRSTGAGVSGDSSSSPRPPSRGISAYGRRKIHQACGALEMICPLSELLFITCTLPGSTNESMRSLADNASWVVHRLKAWIARRIESKLDCYVWEYQKRGALHLHYVLHCPDSGVAEYIRTNLREEWCRLLDRVGCREGVDMYQRSAGGSWREDKAKVRVEVAAVRKSVARYMAKYLSKSIPSKGFGESGFQAPARWYGVSRPLLEVVRELASTTRFYIGQNVSCIPKFLEQAKSFMESLSVSGSSLFSPFVGCYSVVVSIADGDYDSIASMVQSIVNKRSAMSQFNNLKECDFSDDKTIYAMRVDAKKIAQALVASKPVLQSFVVNSTRSSYVILKELLASPTGVFTAQQLEGFFGDVRFAIVGSQGSYDGSASTIARALKVCDKWLARATPREMED